MKNNLIKGEMNMYIIDTTTSALFIAGLRFKYTKVLSRKSITNESDIMFAATNLYAYGTPFANRGKAKQPHYGPEDIPHLTTILSPLVKKIWSYFNEDPTVPNNQRNFDLLHEKLCDQFMEIFNDDGVYTHTYGNAQKFVNILFKYLTCFSDYASFADLFSYCHVPIDGIILGKFALIYRVPNTKGTVYRGHYHGKYCGVCWSSMSKEHYMQLLDDYRCALASIKGNNSWLGLEYAIWPGATIPTTGTYATPIAEFCM
jgi:hypothetical protein